MKSNAKDKETNLEYEHAMVQAKKKAERITKHEIHVALLLLMKNGLNVDTRHTKDVRNSSSKVTRG
jgi:hypothetical protein